MLHFWVVLFLALILVSSDVDECRSGYLPFLYVPPFSYGTVFYVNPT